MRKYILALALIAVCASAYAQKPTKEEKKAARMERREEAKREQRIRDSLFWADINIKDSIRREERKKEGATDIIALVSVSPDIAMDHIAKGLIRSSYMIEANKEYGTIKTEPIHAGMADYTLYFAIEGTEQQSIIRACGFAHTNTGIAMHGIVRTHNVTVKLENVGVEGSTCKVAFKELERILKSFEGVILKYEKNL